jgi:uncharacterized protein YfbU (UPF0304 family)
MSKIMWSRAYRLKIPIPPEIPKRDIDKEFERITGKDCDEAAKVLNDADFRQAMERAMRQLQEKKKKEKRPVELAA